MYPGGTDDRWLYAWGLGSVAVGAASLLVPLYVVELGVLAATAVVVGAPGALVVGRVAERTAHRRRVLLAVALSLAVLPLLFSVTAVVVVNAALWLVWAAVAPVPTMLVVDGVPDSAWNRRIGRLNTYQGYGWAGGLVLGMGWTAVGGRVLSPLLAQRSLFLACALCAAGGLVGAARSLPAVAAGERTAVETRRIERFVADSRRAVEPRGDVETGRSRSPVQPVRPVPLTPGARRRWRRRRP